MGMWIEYEEIYCNYGGPLAENSPPNSAILVVLILLFIGAVIYRFHKALRLSSAEMVFIYAALLVAAPLMTQGMWHRIFGLMAAIPHESDFKSYESLPDMLWPHGKNLVVNGRFVNVVQKDGVTVPDGFLFTRTGDAKLAWEDHVKWRDKEWKCPVLDNTADPKAKSSLSFTIQRNDGAKEVLVPGETFLLSLLVKASDLQAGSSYSVKSQADAGRNIRSSSTPVPAARPLRCRTVFSASAFRRLPSRWISISS